MTKFLENKNTPSKSRYLKLKIVQQDTISIVPKTKLLSIQISVVHPPDKYAHVRLSRSSLSYNLEASKMLYGKPPWELSPEQAEHFEGFQEYMTRNGRPI